MRSLLVPAAVLAVLPACTDGAGAIAVRHDDPLVTATQFTCTGQWPSTMTPCVYPWQSQPDATAHTSDDGHLRIDLDRTPIPTDGGASVVELELVFDGNGAVVAATATESTTRPGDVRVIETSAAVGGWISAPHASPDPSVAQDGAFSVDFGWGSIAGTYVTAP